MNLVNHVPAKLLGYWLATPAILFCYAGWSAAQPKLVVPESVLFEPGIEYANPDGQHLQFDMARPKTGDGPFPAVVCIHGGGFRAGSRQGYDDLCLKLAQQ